MQITIFVSIVSRQRRVCTTLLLLLMPSIDWHVVMVGRRTDVTRCRVHVKPATGFGKYVSHFACDASFRNRHVPLQAF